jgi:hypothetical protein
MSVSLILSAHALREATRQGGDEAIVRHVAEMPEQILQIRPGREVRQTRVPFPPDGTV